MVAVAVNVTAVPVHTVVPGLAAILTLTGKFGFTVIVILFEVTGFTVVQVNEDVITQLTTSVLASEALV